MNKTVIIASLIAAGAGFVAGLMVQQAMDKGKPAEFESSTHRKDGNSEALQAEIGQAVKEKNAEKLRYEHELTGLREELSNMKTERDAALKNAVEAGSGLAVEIPENTLPEPAEKKIISDEDMRKYAKALAKMRKLKQEGKDPNSDPEVQTALMEFIGDFLKITAKYGIDPMSPMGFYNAPEVRELIYGLTGAFFDEMSLPLSEFQKAKIQEIIAKTGEQAEKMKDDTISEVQKQINMYDFYAEKNRELRDVLSAEQYSVMAESEILPIVSSSSGYTRSVWDEAEDRLGAENAVLSKWADEMELNDAEKQNLTASAERFVYDYAELKSSFESKYGKEFIDMFLADPGNDKKEREAFWAKKEEYEKQNPDYKIKSGEVETEFLKLQLKYQEEMTGYLPKEKEEAVKKQNPLIFKFPNLK